MKLSKEQIQLINQTLISKGVVYEDVKLELIDHIASEIEREIDDNDSNFEEVFPIFLKKWEKLLKPTNNSFWLGIVLVGPKIVVDKWVSYSKRKYFFALIYGSFFSILLTTFFYVNHQDKVVSVVNDSIRLLFFLNALFTISGLFLILKSKIKTTFGQMFIRQSFFAFFGFFQIGLHPRENFYLYDSDNSWFWNFFGIFLILLIFMFSFLNFKMVLEHFKTVKKYKLI